MKIKIKPEKFIVEIEESRLGIKRYVKLETKENADYLIKDIRSISFTTSPDIMLWWTIKMLKYGDSTSSCIVIYEDDQDLTFKELTNNILT